MARLAHSWFVALLLMAWLLPTLATTSIHFSAQELAQLRSLGPWPPEVRPDPSNRVSGQPQAVALGRLLFGDPRMSPVGYIACVTCHQPDRAFTDKKARAHGLADLPRNTPALANLRLQQWYGWGGASDSLWMASIRPILDTREFDGSPATVVRLFERDAELARCYEQVFAASPFGDPQHTIVNVGKALAAFQETLVTGRTAYDDFRDALLRNDAPEAARYPAAAARGLRLFIGPAACVACHRGPGLTDGRFHAATDSSPVSPTAPSTTGGRLDDARQLLASPLNLLGAHNDDPARTAAHTRQLSVHPGLRGGHRTPSLRNVAVTAPYLHDGRFEALRDAVRHKLPAAAAPGARSVRPLTSQDVDDLVAFLSTLTDAHGERRPWTPIGEASCQ